MKPGTGIATMKLGTYKSPKHICIIGDPVNFYVWVREVPVEEATQDCASDWFTGASAFEKFNKLRQLWRNTSKAEWCSYAKELHKSNPKRN